MVDHRQYQFEHAKALGLSFSLHVSSASGQD